jgi:hypothetical protein
MEGGAMKVNLVSSWPKKQDVHFVITLQNEGKRVKMSRVKVELHESSEEGPETDDEADADFTREDEGGSRADDIDWQVNWLHSALARGGSMLSAIRHMDDCTNEH